MEGQSNSPVNRILAVMLLSVVGGVLMFGGVGAWMLGEERIWTLAQWITAGIVAILFGAAVSIPIFSSSFPIRARTRGPEQAMTTISNITHKYEGLQSKEKEIHYGEPASSNRVLTSGPYPNPPFAITGGGQFDMLPAPKQDGAYSWEQLPANAEANADTWEDAA